jgi:hypothetical protein
VQAAFICALCALMFGLSRWTPAPVWNLFFVWTLVLALGTLVRLGYYLVQRWPIGVGHDDTRYSGRSLSLSKGDRESPAVAWISNAWAVFQTFVFITFTRLFFRSGSNLDPALANEEAWNTAKNMVTQIGSAWNLSILPRVAWQHRYVLIVFAVGMLIHWIPEKWKRRYRIRFASLPLFLMVLAVFLAVVFVYQFITADLQSFIYFQF